MSRVAYRATKSLLIRMHVVLRETCIGEYLREVVALRAHREWASNAGIRIRKQISDDSPRHYRLRELVVALENVRIDRTMRTVGSGAAKLAIVIAIVAVRAQQLCSYGSCRCKTFFIEHVY